MQRTQRVLCLCMVGRDSGNMYAMLVKVTVCMVECVCVSHILGYTLSHNVQNNYGCLWRHVLTIYVVSECLTTLYWLGVRE